MTSAQLVTAGSAPTLGVWDNPPAVAPRGTVIVVAGRGEHPGVYERFATRIAFDGYRVRVVGDPTADEETVAEHIRLVLADPDLPAPRVLVGSDSGAAYVAAAAATGKAAVEGLILVGLPTDEATAQNSADWDAELGQRTACPTHQGRLNNDPHVRRGALGEAVPANWLTDGDLSRIQVPVLAVHGESDSVSSPAAARTRVAAATTAEFVTIAGGQHDALNDATHRTAAAVVVLFLERLRAAQVGQVGQATKAAAGSELPAIARWTSS